MHDYASKEALISIGLTSGLGSVAYSVVGFSSSAPEMLWREVMPGPRKRRNVPAWRRYNSHRLIISTVFDRWPPAVISLGPPSSDDEPIEWITLMRAAIFELGRWRKIPVLVFDDDVQIARGLGAPDIGRGSSLKALVRRQMPNFSSNKRRIILATATAMAGATQFRTQLREAQAQ